MEKQIILKKLKSKGGVEYFQLSIKGKVAEQVLSMDTNLLIALLGEDTLDMKVDEVKQVGKFIIGVK